jgi:hypothetical protein
MSSDIGSPLPDDNQRQRSAREKVAFRFCREWYWMLSDSQLLFAANN